MLCSDVHRPRPDDTPGLDDADDINVGLTVDQPMSFTGVDNNAAGAGLGIGAVGGPAYTI
jgi:hypothetical protein